MTSTQKVGGGGGLSKTRRSLTWVEAGMDIHFVII